MSEENTLLFPEKLTPGYYQQKERWEKRLNRLIPDEEFLDNYWIPPENGLASGNSIFDPVLCEVLYKWFCPPGGAIIDPFAGGSVRGIVAASLGFKYTGVDLRSEQVEANKSQWPSIKPKCPEAQDPTWIAGDSRNIKKIAKGEYDLILSCPPYADLEVYSDDPNDISNLEYEEFVKAYNEIITNTVSMLKEDRFACWIVGDVRDPKGFYRNFPGDTINAFQKAGATLYNEAILVTSCGSLPVRAGRAFSSGRKLGKTHQNILIFYKGDPAKIKENFPEITEEQTDA